MRTVLAVILCIAVFIVTGVTACRMMQYEYAVQEMK